MPGSRSGPKTNSPRTSSTAISPQPTWSNTRQEYGGSVARVVLQGDLELLLGAPAVEGQRHAVADLVLADRDDQLVHAADLGVTDRRDDVAGPHSGLLRRAAGHDGTHQRS